MGISTFSWLECPHELCSNRASSNRALGAQPAVDAADVRIFRSANLSGLATTRK
jgi:hypothetical protein